MLFTHTSKIRMILDCQCGFVGMNADIGASLHSIPETLLDLKEDYEYIFEQLSFKVYSTLS
jgi:hypothetical protein